MMSIAPARPSLLARASVLPLLVVFLSAVASLTAPVLAAADAGPTAAKASRNGPVESANARFLADTYEALLGRPIDESGLDYQLDVIKAGGDRSRRLVTYGLLFSAEGSRHEVRHSYDELLGRQPDPAGEDHWTNHLQGRGVLDLRVLLLASDEYYANAGGSDRTWLESVYRDVLGRPSDPAGLAYWLELAGSGVPRALIVAGLYLSDEALGLRVDAYYREALGRTPSAAERAGGIPIVLAEGERGLRARLWASDEHFEPYLDAVIR